MLCSHEYVGSQQHAWALLRPSQMINSLPGRILLSCSRSVAAGFGARGFRGSSRSELPFSSLSKSCLAAVWSPAVIRVPNTKLRGGLLQTRITISIATLGDQCAGSRGATDQHELRWASSVSLLLLTEALPINLEHSCHATGLTQAMWPYPSARFHMLCCCRL